MQSPKSWHSHFHPLRTHCSSSKSTQTLNPKTLRSHLHYFQTMHSTLEPILSRTSWRLAFPPVAEELFELEVEAVPDPDEPALALPPDPDDAFDP